MTTEPAVKQAPLLINGVCDPRFAAVREEFQRNFESRGEIGAAVCVYRDGRKVVDLWGATRTRRARFPGPRTPSSS